MDKKTKKDVQANENKQETKSKNQYGAFLGDIERLELELDNDYYSLDEGKQNEK